MNLFFFQVSSVLWKFVLFELLDSYGFLKGAVRGNWRSEKIEINLTF